MLGTVSGFSIETVSQYNRVAMVFQGFSPITAWTYHLWCIWPADPVGDECQRFLLHCAHALDKGLLGDIFSIGSYGTAHILTHYFIDIQHVQVDTTQLER